MDKIHLRPMGESDRNFVIANWLNSYKQHGTAMQRVRNDVYYPEYEPKIKELLQRSAVLIACLEDDWDVICGFVVWEDNRIVHYVYVKEHWRRLGIARHLMEHISLPAMPWFTHWTRPVDSLINKLEWVYNPFLINRE